MLRLSCAYVRRELSAFHDEELPVGERIAIAAHLQDCPACRVEAEDLCTMREALRWTAAAFQAGSEPDLYAVESEILERIQAEKKDSLLRRVGRLVDDPGRAWATGLAALTACALLVAAIMTTSAVGHPGSLAAVLDARSRAVRVSVTGAVVLPRANPDAVMPAAVLSQCKSPDGVAAFAAIVTREGYLAEVTLLSAEPLTTTTEAGDSALMSDLLAAAATARFEPARVAGSPIAVNVVWLLTHKTVHGSSAESRSVARTWPPVAPPVRPPRLRG